MSGIYEDYLDITNRADNENENSNLNAIHLLDDDEFPLFFHSNPSSIIHNIIRKNKCSNNTTTTSMPSPKTHIRKISHHAEDHQDCDSHNSQSISINQEDDDEEELCGNGSEADASNSSSGSSSGSSHHVKHVSYVHSNSPTSSNNQSAHTHMRSRSGMVYSPISTPKSLSSSSNNNGGQRKYNQSKASASIPSFALPHAPTQSFEEDDRDNKGQYYDSAANLVSTVTVSDGTSRKIILYSTLDGSPVYEPPIDTRTTNIEQTELGDLDVLCGRGGGTNSWIGNRRYRAVVQSYQPTYLKAKRKEKPMLAREIVCVIRSQGGRFLKKSSGNSVHYEDIGDHKAEAKTAQALREGLDVRATNAAASNLLFPKSSAASGGGKKLSLSPRRSPSKRGGRKNIIYSSIHPAVAGPVCFVPHVGPSLPMLSPTTSTAPVPATPTVKRTRFEDDCENNVSVAAAAPASAPEGNAFVPPLSPATKRMRAEQQYDANECEYDDRRDDGYPPQSTQYQYQYPQQQQNNYYPPQSTQYHYQGGYYYGAQHHQQQQPQFTPGQFEYWSPRSWDQEEDHEEDEEDSVQV
eukprot:CAMPEP_0116033200 /NCGR_PEP_ID=MMETSP0321-20121206/18803_1 /TAXON_ID=163516 /ORGANISM="Leptocylindrus danicus var. danicus, Strain B650" /LENGTH=576 /DNA_ID=CAMNT_0003509141 /DNA_START=434 /DNA_END=2164 /DNA_ORIENTATION=-